MKWWQKKVRGWIVPFWYTDTPLFSKRFAELSEEQKGVPYNVRPDVALHPLGSSSGLGGFQPTPEEVCQSKVGQGPKEGSQGHSWSVTMELWKPDPGTRGRSSLFFDDLSAHSVRGRPAQAHCGPRRINLGRL